AKAETRTPPRSAAIDTADGYGPGRSSAVSYTAPDTGAYARATAGSYAEHAADEYVEAQGDAYPGVDSDLDSPEVHRVVPDVPDSARRTIRGRVRVSVRVIVEKEGTVFAALAEEPGPSRYFERLAIEAAKQWTFAPAESDDQRLMLV